MNQINKNNPRKADNNRDELGLACIILIKNTEEQDKQNSEKAEE